jgi:DNA-binding transcriptional regulator GbsR (MarR family)
MTSNKAKTPNSQIYSMTSTRLKLKRREKTIFYRLLGFLIRNDKPFPYSTKALSELTGYSRSSVYECLNTLENLRLIKRVGFTNQVRFIKGTLLNRICSLVQNRSKVNLNKNSTLVQKVNELKPTSPETGYKKTSSSLKLKNKDSNLSKSTKERILYNTMYHPYVKDIECEIELGLKSKYFPILSFEQWKLVA